MLTRSIAIVYDDPNLLNMYSEALKMSGYDDVSSFTVSALNIFNALEPFKDKK